MNHSSVHVVISELGTNWARGVEAQFGRFGRIFTVLQAESETAVAFAGRVGETLLRIGTVSGASLLCSHAYDRSAVAARQLMVSACLSAMRGVNHRELSLVCDPTAKGFLPRWAEAVATGIEDSDPALSLFVECEVGSEARAAVATIAAA